MRPTGGVVIVRRSHTFGLPGDPWQGLPSRVPRQGSGAGCLHPGQRRWHGLVVVRRCQAASCATVGQAVLPGPARSELRRTDRPSTLGSAGRSSDWGHAWVVDCVKHHHRVPNPVADRFGVLLTTGLGSRSLLPRRDRLAGGGAVHPCLGLLAFGGCEARTPCVVTHPVGRGPGGGPGRLQCGRAARVDARTTWLSGWVRRRLTDARPSTRCCLGRAAVLVNRGLAGHPAGRGGACRPPRPPSPAVVFCGAGARGLVRG